MKRETAEAAGDAQDEPLRTEPVTTEDLTVGRLRIPIESAVLLPAEDCEVSFVLRGTPGSGQWQVILAGDGEGRGSLRLDASLLSALIEVDDALILTEGEGPEIYID